ncbi:hypothetical protein [Micromonospora yangpuensis]|uniref:Uncharacterized protein n=1 Tax=Micromonospora yangpuensis TaxID=683228 RepID=A0A1C6U1R0_9ACTN|nr:hypothetical protein [Micromonospora yangpuensis]GGM10775.1 hypothetical protein GCM10012279_31000 [Micromonospora yangpuensis]SCL47992.1 hypothetical protein GA0070617_0743 [Micromonospora yangpuensis]
MARWKWFQRREEPVDVVGPATRYSRQDGQPRGRLVVKASHPVVDQPTAVYPQARPLLTRAGWWRSSRCVATTRRDGGTARRGDGATREETGER